MTGAVPQAGAIMRTEILIAIAFFSVQSIAQTPPYPAALSNAAITETTLADKNANALPLGNGDLNGLLFYQGSDLVLNLSKNDVWDARIITNSDPVLPTINVAAHTWTGTQSAPPSYNTPYPCPVPSGVVKILAAGTVRSARLDLDKPLATVVTSADTVLVRVLAQRNVFVIQTKQNVSISGYAQSFLPAATTGTQGSISWVRQTLPADTDYAGMHYYVALGASGNRKVVAVVSSRESTNPLTDAVQLVTQTLAEDAVAMVRVHDSTWTRFWSASGVLLGDLSFQNWWYRMVYFFRCYSKPGVQAVGLWAGDYASVNWHGDYHSNYNSWQPFWTSFNTNHPELAEPFIDLMNQYNPRARWLAGASYGCEGSFAPISIFAYEPDPAVCKSKNRRMCHMIPWGATIGMGGHMIQNMWTHYLYKPDTAYLSAKLYPVIRDYALFYASFIEKCRMAGSVVDLGPSYDPENSPFGIDNSPYDIAYARYTLDAAVKAANVLGRDASLVTRLTAARAKLPGYPTAVDGTSGNTVVQAWKGCRVGDVGEYNIPTPVVPLFPAEQLSWFSPDSEKTLFRNTINWNFTCVRRANMQVMFQVARARLSMTADAFTDAKQWFTSQARPNGLFYWDLHGYYLSEQVAVAAMIGEFLMQSVSNIIRVFPCWPAAISAQFTDLRAQGGFLVSAKMTSGIVSDLIIRTTVGDTLRLVSPWDTIRATFTDGTTQTLTYDSRKVVTLATLPNDTIRFSGTGGGVSIRTQVVTYRFEEPSGATVYDSSGNHNNGTIVGTVARTAGHRGTALSFDGNSYVTTANDSTMANPNGEMTIDLWVNPQVSGRSMSLVRKISDGGSDGYLLDILTSNRARFIMGSMLIVTQMTIPANQWTNIKATIRAGDRMRIYINNAMSADTSASLATVVNNSLALRLGASLSGLEKFTGYLDEVIISNTCWDPSVPVMLLINTPAARADLRIVKKGAATEFIVTANGAHCISVFGLDGRMRAVFNGRGNRTYRWNPRVPGVFVVRIQTKQGTYSRKVEINL